MDGWVVGGWVEKRGIFFHMTLCWRGLASHPHSLSFFPRRTVSVTGLAVLASLGHSGIPPCHAPHPPASGCLLPSEGFHLYWSWFSCLSFIFCVPVYGQIYLYILRICLSYFWVYKWGLLEKKQQQEKTTWLGNGVAKFPWSIIKHA